MKKEWFFDRFCGHQLVAYAEDGKLIEVGAEDERRGDVLGNIYKGRVANVVPGMQAAFVACGMERNCYLPLDEGAALFSQYDGVQGLESLTLREGDEILVQVVKPPRGNKGAKVSCALSFVGKNLIFLPKTDFLGISRKITDEAVRAALLKEADKLREAGQGFIVRTAAAGATKRHLKTESEYLKRIYRSVLESAKTAPVGSAVYREYDLPIKVMRDSLGDGDAHLYVGDNELYEKLLQLTRMRSDLGEKKLVHYTGARNMFSHYKLDEQIYALADPRIRLENGAYLVIDRTEAMTVFDVNTGRYTGEVDLESTVFETNLLAAREIARQVRLRNVGGIVAVDFIDMAEEEHRAAVGRELEEALSRDRTKSRVLPMSDLCVTLFTRKRRNNELATFMLKPCNHCTRQGFVLSDIYLAMRIRSAILNCFADGYEAAIVDLNRPLMQAILSERYFSGELAGPWKEKRIYFVPHASYPEEKFTVRGDNASVLTLPDDAQILY